MSVTIDADANTILISQDSNAVSVTQLGGLVTVVDPAAGNVSVTFPENAIAVSSPGTTGAQGPVGPQGNPGGPVANLDDLNDVVITTVQADNLIRYSGTAEQWINTSILDGGNY